MTEFPQRRDARARVIQRLLFWLLAILLFPQPSLLSAQTNLPFTNHVLDLDGTDGCVELPPDIFKGLDATTIETWVKFRDLSQSRFYSYGGYQHDLCVGRRRPYAGSDLDVFVNQNQNPLDEVVIPGIIQTDVWYHVAVVLGPGGMELHVDGVLAGTNPSPASFSKLGTGSIHFLGRMNGGPGEKPTFFHGQLAEFRVWKTRRTPEQIRDNMFRQLTGGEPGLAGLWNFENITNGVVRDATPGAHHGKLMGHAKIAGAQLPGSVQATVMGSVLQLDGTNSFVEFPQGAFMNLHQVTVEGWVRWERFGSMSRFFDFALADQRLDVLNRGTSSTLWLERIGSNYVDHVALSNALSLGQRFRKVVEVSRWGRGFDF